MDWLQERLPNLAVLSVNLLREPVARVEGDEGDYPFGASDPTDAGE